MKKHARFLELLAFLILFAQNGFGQSGTITTYAGRLYPPIGTPALNWSIIAWGIVGDNAGGFYYSGYRGAYHVSSTGIIQFVEPGSIYDLALDADGNLYLSEGFRIRKRTPAGVLSTIAGGDGYGFGGDGGPATQALISVGEIALDSNGNLYLADTGNHRIRRIDTKGIITTIAGTGAPGFSGDGGPAILAEFYAPQGIAVDAAGNVFIGDTQNYRVRKIDSRGIITPVAGNGIDDFSGDGGPATDASVGLARGLAIDAAGNLYITDIGRIRKVTPNGVISTYGGVGAGPGVPVGNGAAVSQVRIANVQDIAIDGSGTMWIADIQQISKVTPDGILTYAAGNGLVYSGDGAAATLAQISSPETLAFDTAGNFYIAETFTSHIRKVTPDGVIHGFVPGRAVTTDTAGNIYSSTDSRILKWFPQGNYSIVAGTTTAGFSGDGGPAASALLSSPTSIVLDAGGNLYVNDAGNQRIRKVSPAGVISTLAELAASDITVDAAGNLYASGSETHAVYKIAPGGGMTVIAGSSVAGFSGDGGAAVAARLSSPRGLVLDSAGNLYIADSNNNRVRRVTPTGLITTVVGAGTRGYDGDGGPAGSALLNSPTGLMMDTLANLYVSDTGNNVVRKIERSVSTGIFEYSVSSTGAVSRVSQGQSNTLTTGFARFQSHRSGVTPSGLAILGYRQGGVLVSEATVPALQPFRSGRFYVETSASVNTGVAIVNPNDRAASVSFFFTGSIGDVRSGTLSVPANEQRTAFLNEPPFFIGALFRGTFSFSSDIPVGVVALRGLSNQRGEFLMTTLPVVDLAAPTRTTPLVFPHFAEGGGWTSQIVLTNPTSSTISGTASFFDPAGNPLSLRIDNQMNDNVAYSLPPRGAQRFVLSGSSETTQSGSIRVTPAMNSSTPAGLVIFSFSRGGVTVTETGVPAISQAFAFRLFVESSGPLQTGFAISNPTNVPIVVRLDLYGLDGSPTGLTETLGISGNGQVATFLNSLNGFRSLQAGFQGILRISSSTQIAAIGLRGRYNERGDFLIATTPPTNEADSLVTSEAVIPHFAVGGGYTTQFVLFSGAPGQEGAGTLQVFTPSGYPAGVPLN